jgi:hypothetical protein
MAVNADCCAIVPRSIDYFYVSRMKLAMLLSRNQSNLALLIGNGINRYGSNVMGNGCLV